LKIDYYKKFTGITPFSRKYIHVKTYFMSILSKEFISPSAEIEEVKYIKDFEHLQLSDITKDIIATLQKD